MISRHPYYDPLSLALPELAIILHHPHSTARAASTTSARCTHPRTSSPSTTRLSSVYASMGLGAGSSRQGKMMWSDLATLSMGMSQRPSSGLLAQVSMYVCMYVCKYVVLLFISSQYSRSILSVLSLAQPRTKQ